MKYVAAFRTYTWNETVADLAGRFFASFPGGYPVIIADKSHGDLGIVSDYPIIWHGDNAAELDVASYPPGRTHWYNVDYALYMSRDKLPDYDFYVTSESDLAINLPLEHVLSYCKAENIDAVIHDLKPSTPDWHWHSNGAAVFEQPWRSLCFFMIMSAQAVDTLWEARRRQTVEFEQGRLAVWPFCETFIPTLLKLKGLSVEEIASFAETKYLRFRPKLAIDDTRANAPGSMAHSVLPRSAFFKTAVSESPPENWFKPESELRITLEGHPLGEFAGFLRQSFQNARDHAGYQAFVGEMVATGLPIADEPDLAFCKPAISSSTSAWSNFSQPWLDAACANGVDTFPDFAFHTSNEVEPWWMVDLMDDYVVDAVKIVNRAGHAERFRRFHIQSSSDGTQWNTRYSKIDLESVSSQLEVPYHKGFSDPFVARFVKIVLIDQGYLHLRRVQVFGRSIKPKNDV